MAKFISKYWKHGEDFRKVYNAHYGVNVEEGIANPAIVTVGT